jgi:hypothetical protein
LFNLFLICKYCCKYVGINFLICIFVNNKTAIFSVYFVQVYQEVFLFVYNVINKVLFLKNMFCVRSALNGLNGEFTNTDDYLPNAVYDREFLDIPVVHHWVTAASIHLLQDNQVIFVLSDVFNPGVEFAYWLHPPEGATVEDIHDYVFNFDPNEHIDSHFYRHTPSIHQVIAFHVLTSQLNGSHGEATNSDDVVIGMTARDRVAMNIRNRKEAITTKYKKNPGATNKGNNETRKHKKLEVEYVPSARINYLNEVAPYRVMINDKNRNKKDSSSTTDNSHHDDSSHSSDDNNSQNSSDSSLTRTSIKSNSVPVFDVSTSYYIPQDPTLHLFYDGNEFFDEPFAEPYEGANRGLCEDCGPGYIIVNSNPKLNKKHIKITPCLEKIIIEGYYRRDQFGKHLFFEAETYEVSNALLYMFQKQLTSSRADESLTNACLALANRTQIPNRYQVSTISYYLAVIHRKESRVKGATGLFERYTNNGGVIGEGDFGRIENSVQLGVDVNIYAPLYELDAECNLPDYPIRDDFQIISDPLNVVDANRKFRFRTYRNTPKHQGLTKFFSFRGRGQPTFVEYNESANNLNHALKRVIGCRENESQYRQNALKLGRLIYQKKMFLRRNPKLTRVYEKLRGGRVINNNLPDTALDWSTREFIANNILNISNNCHRSRIRRVIDTVYTRSSWAYFKVYEEILTVFHPLLSRETNANMIHIKRALRRQYVNGRRLHTDDDIMVQNAKTSIKRELAKPGKAPRLFVNYDAGSMYAGELPEFVKMCIDGMHIFNAYGKTHALYIMSKPRSDTLEKLFKMLKDALSNNNFCQSIIYSDDSCISGLSNNRSFGFNVDVSSNDSSQDMPAFLVSYLAMRRFHEMRAEGLIDQSLLPIIITNDENPSEKVKIKFKGPFEGSGNLLTTVLNHFGSAMIHLGAFYRWASGMEEMEVALINSARVVGHIVTVEKWGFDGNNFDKCQFIKRSPACDVGIYPAINMGVILRSIGSVWDELSNQKLPEKTHLEFVTMTLDERMQLYFSKIIQGWQHENVNSIFTSLRKRFNTSSAEVIKHDSLMYVLDEHDVKDYSNRIGDNHLMSRYGLTKSEIEEACVLIENIQLGMHVSCSAFSKIFHVDYSLPLPVGLVVN